MKWINFLHIYQPPTQTKDIVDKVTKESYALIISLLKKYPRLVLTMNINGSLLELWEKYGYTEIISEFRAMVDAGRIELVGSAMYHPILPLIPQDEVTKQIALHEKISKRIFGGSFKPKGFYLPEMAYDSATGKIIKDMGYEWIILDEIHAGTTVDPTHAYTIKDNDLAVVFRNNIASKTFPPEYIFEKSLTSLPYLITAHDGELYGHWHRDDRGFYEKAFTSHDIEFIKVSEYLSSLTSTVTVPVRSANWESTEDEIGSNVPFSLWKSPRNDIHAMLWDLAETSSSIIKKHTKDPGVEIGSRHLSRGLSSCAWWWANERKLGAFSPETWNPTEIEKGATELILAVRSLRKISATSKKTVEEKFKKLHDVVWNKHWQKQLQK